VLLDNYSKISTEEKANVISHAVALLIFLICIPVLITQALGSLSTSSTIGFLIFSLMTIFGYFASVRYHIAVSWRKFGSLEDMRSSQCSHIYF